MTVAAARGIRALGPTVPIVIYEQGDEREVSFRFMITKVFAFKNYSAQIPELILYFQ